MSTHRILTSCMGDVDYDKLGIEDHTRSGQVVKFNKGEERAYISDYCQT